MKNFLRSGSPIWVVVFLNCCLQLFGFNLPNSRLSRFGVPCYFPVLSGFHNSPLQPKFSTFSLSMARKKKDWNYDEPNADGFYEEEYSGELDDEEMKNEKLRNPKEMNDKEWMFFDVARVFVKGGDGGDGCMAMRREYCLEHGGPSGGNGGHGGHVYLQCDRNLNTLSFLRQKVHHKAKDGTNGKGDSRHGYKGENSIIPVPPGTIVRDQDGAFAGELNHHGERLMVARGGKGGRGNEYFKTARHNVPEFAEKGELGCERWIHVELKLIADVGLVGVPNAGKSTLLAAVTNAKPKIADYPFTTVVPNLGVCDVFPVTEGGDVSSSMVIADIPGLLEGAHLGVGLGLAFLRHIQRCKLLIHVIRGDSPDPIGDFQAINQELELFNPHLANKTQVIVINKIDLPEVADQLPSLVHQLKQVAGHSRILPISAASRTNVKELMMRVHKMLQTLPTQSTLDLILGDEEKRVNFAVEDDFVEDNSSLDDLHEDAKFDIEDDEFAGKHRRNKKSSLNGGSFARFASVQRYNKPVLGIDYEILTDRAYPGQFRITGKRLERLVQMTNWDYYESILRFQRILEAQGISQSLEAAGVKEGDLVMIGDWEFHYSSSKNKWLANLGKEDISR